MKKSPKIARKSWISICFIVFSALTMMAQKPSKKSKKQDVPPVNKIATGSIDYKFERQLKSGKKPAKGDMLTLNLSYSLQRPTGDTLLFDSKFLPQQSIRVPLNSPGFKGDIMEALEMLETGDSITFTVPADSFFLRTAGSEIPKHIPPNSKLIFHVGLIRFVTQKEYQFERAQLDTISMEQEKLDLRRYLIENNIKIQPRKSGLIIIPSTAGGGPKPQRGDTVKVHYTGYLMNGQKFDSSVDRGEPFSFVLGMGQVIAGWDEGIAELQTGGKAKFIIPSSIGYGPRGAGQTIPPFATLIFEVELLKIE